MIGIIEEHALGHALRQKDIDALLSHGIAPMFLARTYHGEYSFILRDRIVPMGDTFEFARHRPDADGINAYTVVLFDDDGEPLDILAWREPEAMLWTGRAPMAGAEQVLMPRLGEPLFVHESILGWLKSGRRGLFLFDYRQSAAILVNESLCVETEPHARHLRTRLIRPAPPVSLVASLECAA